MLGKGFNEQLLARLPGLLLNQVVSKVTFQFLSLNFHFIVYAAFSRSLNFSLNFLQTSRSISCKVVYISAHDLILINSLSDCLQTYLRVMAKMSVISRYLSELKMD